MLGKQMTNIGKRSFDSRGEKVSLHGCKITIYLFKKLMMESVTEKRLH